MLCAIRSMEQRRAGLAIPTANLVGLYRTDSPAYYHLTSGRVDTLYDQSGAGHDLTQGAANNRPLIASAGGPTGQDCGDFTLNAGLSRHIANASMGLGSTVSLYSVCQAPGGTRYISDGGAAPDTRIVFGDGTNIKLYAGAASCLVAVTPGTWGVHAGVVAGASSFGIWQGGAAVTGNPGTPSDVGLTFGGRQDGASAAGLNAKALLLAVYATAHSTGTAAGIISTLRAWSGV